MICLHEPHGFAEVLDTIAMALKDVIPCDKAEYIATLSAHRVLGYTADSILQPKTIESSFVKIAHPTGNLLYFYCEFPCAIVAFFISSIGFIINISII